MIEDYFKQKFWKAQKQNKLCAEFLAQLEKNEIMRTYKITKGFLVIYVDRQDADVKIWLVANPNDEEVRRKSLNECHTVPYSAYPGVQRRLSKFRQKFYWKGETNDGRDFVSSCIIFQTENSDHTLSKGRLQNPEIPVQK